MAKRYAKEIGKPYESLNLIVCHMGGGVSVGAHVKGEVVDTGNALEGEGPFSPSGPGRLPSGALVDLCFSGKYTEQEIRRMITGNGGLLAYTGSTDMQGADAPGRHRRPRCRRSSTPSTTGSPRRSVLWPPP